MSEIQIKVKSSSREIFDSFIDPHFLVSLKPFNMIQALFVSAKYQIKDGCITPNSLPYDIASVLVKIILFNSYIYFLLTDNITIFNSFHASIITVGYIMHCYTNITQKHSYTSLIIKIENLDKSLKIDSYFFKRFLVSNLTEVIFILLFYLTFLLLLCSVFGFRDILKT